MKCLLIQWHCLIVVGMAENEAVNEKVVDAAEAVAAVEVVAAAVAVAKDATAAEVVAEAEAEAEAVVVMVVMVVMVATIRKVSTRFDSETELRKLFNLSPRKGLFTLAIFAGIPVRFPSLDRCE